MMHLKPGTRKGTYGAIAVVSMIVYAACMKASFDDFRNGIMAWLFLMLSGHIADQKFNASPPVSQ